MSYKFKYIKILILIISFSVWVSCDGTLFNSGDTITKEIEIGDFKEIYINSIFDVSIHQDTLDQIFVRGGSNLIPNLEFRVDRDKKLSIDDLNSVQWSRSYEKIKLDIHVDTLWFLQLNAPANIECADTLITPDLKILSLSDYSNIKIKLKCDNCNIVNSGTTGGIINISGKANQFYFWARASIQINAENFVSNYVTIKTESIGDCKVHSDKELTVEILNSGNILYTGNPDTIIYRNDKAKNQLIKID